MISHRRSKCQIILYGRRFCLMGARVKRYGIPAGTFPPGNLGIQSKRELGLEWILHWGSPPWETTLRPNFLWASQRGNATLRTNSPSGINCARARTWSRKETERGPQINFKGGGTLEPNDFLERETRALRWGTKSMSRGRDSFEMTGYHMRHTRECLALASCRRR